MSSLSTFARALAGGALIGAAASIFWLANGRRAGVSGMFADALGGAIRDERVAFLAGLVLTGVLVAVAIPGAIGASPASLPLLAIAGLCIGFGTRVSGGCTSGHGVCGVARFSRRSIVATMTFVLCGAITLLVTRHVTGGS
jgi:uncharacterized membrane protein YedE/YeeE